MKLVTHRFGAWYIPLTIALIILAVLPLFGLLPLYWQFVLFLFLIYLAISQMWNLLCGYSGLISLGQPAFIGLAAYFLALSLMWGMPYYAGILIGVAVAVGFAAVISIPTFRMKGIYFAIGTLIVAEILRFFFNSWRPAEAGVGVGGGAGYPIKIAIPLEQYYWLALIVGFASIYVTVIILNSKLGVGLMAIRDNEQAAQTSGINVYRLKLYSFLIAAFITGLAGSVFYLYQGHVEPQSAFGMRWTMIIILSTVIGGLGHVLGPVVGSGIMVALQLTLARYVGISLLIQGVILVGVMLFAPYGIVGALSKIRRFKPKRKSDLERAATVK